MKRRKLLIVGGLILFAGAGLFLFRTVHSAPHSHGTAHKPVYYCPMHPTYTSDRPGDCPICNMKLVKREAGPKEAPSKPKEKKILYWTDPMIPGYKSDRSGKSPMGMDLTPVYEEELSTSPGSEGVSPRGYSPIQVSPQKQQMIGIKVASAQRRRITKTIRTIGRIAYDPELYQAQEEYLQAHRALKKAQGAMNAEVGEQARQLEESAHMRLRLLGLSDEMIEPMNSWQGPDKRLLLADPEGSVWVYASIYEFELPLVQVGQKIQVEIPFVPGKDLEATIQSIDPVVDPMTRSARVRALLIDSSRSLKPQMYVNVSLKVDRGEVLSVPKEAVFDTGVRRIVFVDKGQGFFDPRDVIVGVTADGYDEIKEGVAEGEQVVVNGNFLIDSESRLKAALEGSAPAGDHQHVH